MNNFNKEIWLFNPDYETKWDLDRVCLYSKRKIQYDGCQDWISYIHPVHAHIFRSFRSGKTFKTVIENLSEELNCDTNRLYDLLKSYMNNSESIYVEVKGDKVPLPKNILIPKPSEFKIGNLDNSFDYLDVNVSNICLNQDRSHRAPNSILWMLTNKCILNCKYCYADRNTKNATLPIGRYIELIDEAKMLGIQYVDIIGGEIFLYPYWDIILKKLVDYDIQPTYISTKLPIHGGIIRKLIECKFDGIVQVSLDSINFSTLKEFLCCTPNKMDRIKRTIIDLDKNNFKIQINTVLTKFNTNINEIDALYSFIRNIRNLTLWEIRVPEVSLYNQAEFNMVMTNKESIIKLKEYVIDNIVSIFDKQIVFSDDVLNVDYGTAEDSENCFYGGSCGILKNRFFVLPDGKVTICEQLYWNPNYIIGDLAYQSIEEVWQSKKALKLFRMTEGYYNNESLCIKCGIFEICYKKRRKCIVKTLKAYGKDRWYYPDPRCKYAPFVENNLIYK